MAEKTCNDAGANLPAAPQMDSKERQARLLRLLGELFRKWGLNETCQSHLLQLSLDEWHARAIGSGRQAEAVMERIAYLLSIHRHLRLAFPENPDMRYAWVTTESQAFGGQAPLTVLAAEGLEGMQAVLTYLAHALGTGPGDGIDADLMKLVDDAHVDSDGWSEINRERGPMG